MKQEAESCKKSRPSNKLRYSNSQSWRLPQNVAFNIRKLLLLYIHQNIEKSKLKQNEASSVLLVRGIQQIVVIKARHLLISLISQCLPVVFHLVCNQHPYQKKKYDERN